MLLVRTPNQLCWYVEVHYVEFIYTSTCLNKCPLPNFLEILQLEQGLLINCQVYNKVNLTVFSLEVWCGGRGKGGIALGGEKARGQLSRGQLTCGGIKKGGGGIDKRVIVQGGKWPRGGLSWGGIDQGGIGGDQLSGGNCPEGGGTDLEPFFCHTLSVTLPLPQMYPDTWIPDIIIVTLYTLPHNCVLVCACKSDVLSIKRGCNIISMKYRLTPLRMHGESSFWIWVIFVIS